MTVDDLQALPELGTPEAALRSCVNLISRVTGQPEELLAYWLDLYYQVRRQAEAPAPGERIATPGCGLARNDSPEPPAPPPPRRNRRSRRRTPGRRLRPSSSGKQCSGFGLRAATAYPPRRS